MLLHLPQYQFELFFNIFISNLKICANRYYISLSDLLGLGGRWIFCLKAGNMLLQKKKKIKIIEAKVRKS
ncbi:hypothetical protein P8452_20195 [Trifolium repens]|nr:hypothetical protein P8452_20195 [Trifolium repens]